MSSKHSYLLAIFPAPNTWSFSESNEHWLGTECITSDSKSENLKTQQHLSTHNTPIWGEQSPTTTKEAAEFHKLGTVTGVGTSRVQEGASPWEMAFLIMSPRPDECNISLSLTGDTRKETVRMQREKQS